jgi:hypothetical protein
MDKQIWQGMGGKRPVILRKIEYLLWQAILDMARSPSHDTTAGLKSAFQGIDTLLAADIEIVDIDWFDSGQETLHTSRYPLLIM